MGEVLKKCQTADFQMLCLFAVRLIMSNFAMLKVKTTNHSFSAILNIHTCNELYEINHSDNGLWRSLIFGHSSAQL